MSTEDVRAIAEDDFVTSPPITAGEFEVRLATTPAEIEAAQRLRYRTLYVERGGRPDDAKVLAEADEDEWDAVAHHIIVAFRDRPSRIPPRDGGFETFGLRLANHFACRSDVWRNFRRRGRLNAGGAQDHAEPSSIGSSLPAISRA